MLVRGQAYDLPLDKALGNSQALHQLVAALEGREQLLDGAIDDLKRDLTGRIAMRREAVPFTERHNAQSQAASERLQAAERQADAAAREQQRLRERTETLEAERGTRRADLEAKRAELRQAMAHWRTAQADYQQLIDSGELQTADTRVAQTKNDVMRLEEQLLSADEELVETRRRHYQALEETRRTQTQAEAAHRELADRQQEITEEAREKRDLENDYKEASEQQQRAKSVSDASDPRLKENDRRIADALSRLDEAQRQLDWVNGQRELSKRQWAMLGTHGGFTSLLTLYEWWNPSKASERFHGSKKDWHALLTLLDTTLSTAAATFETASVGARGLYHGRLILLDRAHDIERTADRVNRVAATVTMILGVVDAYHAYEDHNPALAALKTLNVAGGGLLLLSSIEATRARALLGLSGGTLFGVAAAVCFVAYAVLRRYVVEDDTDKWLRQGPWGMDASAPNPTAGGQKTTLSSVTSGWG